jgi:hypothetical protein
MVGYVDATELEQLKIKCDTLAGQLKDAIQERSVFAFQAGEAHGALLVKHKRLKEHLKAVLPFTQRYLTEDVNGYPLSPAVQLCQACGLKGVIHASHCPVKLADQALQDL